MLSSRVKFTAYALRFALAFVFLYAAYSALVRPNDWIGYFPRSVRGIIPDDLLLQIFSIGEIALAIWIILGWKVYLAAALSAIALLGVTVTNLAILDITFRDVGLAASAVALFILTWPRNKQ